MDGKEHKYRVDSKLDFKDRGEFMKKRKKGATLIFVIVIFMFIIVASTGMLSMVAGNYRARISESNRIENLYASESGLDMAYNITGKTIQGGVKYAYYEVAELRCKTNSGPNMTKYNDLNDDIGLLKTDIENLKKNISEEEEKESPNESSIEGWLKEIKKCNNGINKDEKTKQEILKEEFKRAFMSYIKDDSVLSDSKVNEVNILEKSIEEKKYRDINLTFREITVDDETVTQVSPTYKEYNVSLKNDISEGVDNDYPKLEILKIDDDDDEKIKLISDISEDKITNKATGSDNENHHKTITCDKINKAEYIFKVQSQFLSKNASSLVTDSLRKVNCTYKIKVPQYNEILWSNSTGNIYDYTIFSGEVRGLTIGGNMNVDGVTNLVVKGDIFVQGRNADNAEAGIGNNKVFGKYKGGITIDGSTVKFLPSGSSPVNVNTRKTFNIRSTSKVDVEGKIYAGNVYGGKEDGSFINDSSLIADEVITNNDLALSAKNTKIGINNFYGINDKNYSYDEGNDEKNKNIQNISSSIMVNGYEEADGSGKSTIEIFNEAYIMGTAHIDTSKSYKTGESIAVKGNYTAYAVPVNPKEVFKYDEPLQVLDEDDVKKKAEHFSDYWNGIGKGGIKLDKKTADYGGIILPNPDRIYSIGAIVYKMSTADGEGTYVKSNTSSYSLNIEDTGGVIYNKRAEYAKNVYCLGIAEYDDDHDYMNQYLDGESNAEKVSTLLSRLNDESIKAKENLSDYNWKDELAKHKGEYVAIFNGNKNEKITIDHDVNGVIVTNGDVEIEGGVNFKGNIIAGGDLKVSGTGDTLIEYDPEIVKDVIENNGELFETVFEDFKENKEYKEDVDETTKIKETLDGKYDVKIFLEKKLWQLVQ